MNPVIKHVIKWHSKKTVTVQPQSQSKAKSKSETTVNKRKRIRKGQLEKNKSEKLATQDTQNEEKRNKNTTQYIVGHHYTQTNTNKVNKT